MEWDGIINQFTNPWNASLLLVKKIDTGGKNNFRIVMNFRALNKVPPTT